jgi:hypothetical protein
MNRFNGSLAAALALVSCVLGSRAQNAPSTPGASHSPYAVTPVPAVSSGSAYKARLVPEAKNRTPFSLETDQSGTEKWIEFLSKSQMTQPDRDLANRAQASIRENATLAGFEFGLGQWTYQQLGCEALPGHLFLLYKRDNGAGDVTLFSAAISREGNAQARIIPIQRRGFSPFSPAPVNPLTIAAFNRIRSSESQSREPDWLATALCYAALTGAHPKTFPLQQKSSDRSLAISFPPTLEVGDDGESTVRFVDVASPRQPMGWALTFNAKGQLLKVTNSAVPAYAIKLVPQLTAQQTPSTANPPDASSVGPR